MFTHSYGENRTDLLHELRPASFSHSPRDRILSSGLRETRAVPTLGLIKHTRAARPRKIPFDLFYNVEGCRTVAIVPEVLIFSRFLEISRGAQLFAARFFLFDRIFHRARIEWGEDLLLLFESDCCPANEKSYFDTCAPDYSGTREKRRSGVFTYNVYIF